MRFVYFTEKTAPQCMTAITERLQVKGTASRPGLEGWIDKSGHFSLTASSKIARLFTRRTTLQGRAERQSGMTTITGYVSTGLPTGDRIKIFGATFLVGVLLAVSGSLVPGLIVIAVGGLLNIPLAGDYHNSSILLSEVQKTLQAKKTPPPARKTTETKKPISSAGSMAMRRPTTSSTSAKKPAATAARKPAPAKPRTSTPTRTSR